MKTGLGTRVACRWQGLRTEVPGGWEILRFRKDYRAGYLLWADRQDYTFQMSWQRASSARTSAEVCTDYIGKMRLDGFDGPLRKLTIGDWRGVERQVGEKREQRYFGVFDEGASLLELVFVDAGKLDPDLVEAILASTAPDHTGKGRELMWNVFGLSFSAPRSLPLTTCEVLPATTTFTFRETGEQPAEITFSRVGMVRHWLENRLPDWWAAKWQDRRTRVCVEKTLHRGAVTVHLEERHLRPEGAFMKIRPWRRLYSVYWIDPEDKRFYRHSYQCTGLGRPLRIREMGGLRCRDLFDTNHLMKEHFHVAD